MEINYPRVHTHIHTLAHTTFPMAGLWPEFKSPWLPQDPQAPKWAGMEKRYRLEGPYLDQRLEGSKEGGLLTPYCQNQLGPSGPGAPGPRPSHPQSLKFPS